MATKKPFYARLEGSSWGCLDVTFGGMLLNQETPKGFPTDEYVTLETKEFEPLFEKLKDVRKRLQTELENCPEVSEVTDPYSKEDSTIGVGLGISTLGKSEFSGTFSPLVAVLQLPARMQPIARQIPFGTPVDRFVIVLDGTILLLGGLCFPGEYVSGFPDARDKISEIIKKICRVEIVAPNVAPRHLSVVVGRKISGNMRPPVLRLERPQAVRRAMQILYQRLAFPLKIFYTARITAEKDDELVRKIGVSENEMLGQLGSFIDSRFYDVLRRRSISKEIRTSITFVFGLLTEHGECSESVMSDILDIQDRLENDELVRAWLEGNKWKEKLEIQAVDRRSLLAIVEHVRGEIQTSGMLSATIWGGIVGAIVGGMVATFGPMVVGFLGPILAKVFGG